MADSRSSTNAACFNSATAVKPWKPVYCAVYATPRGELQFGHGGEAVETRSPVSEYPVISLLQFGHGGEAVETPALPLRESHAHTLQFGHGGEAVETWACLATNSFERHASIRPRR